MDAFVKFVLDVLNRPRHLKWIAPCLMAGEAILGCLIIWRIPCTSRPRPPLVGKLLNRSSRYRDRLDNVYAASSPLHQW